MIHRLIQKLYTQENNFSLNWDEQELSLCLKQVKQSATSAQLYRQLMDKKCFGIEANHLRQRLKEMALASQAQSMMIKNELERILDIFEINQVEVIPLKGTMFAARVYGHYAARGTSDIDLFIRQESMEQAVQCLAKAGFLDKADDPPDHFHCTFFKPLLGVHLPLEVELHSGLTMTYSAPFHLQRFWDGASAYENYDYVKEMSAQHLLYAACLHGANHLMDSIKYVLDIAQIVSVYGKDIDIQALLEQAQTDHTLKRISYALNITCRTMPQHIMHDFMAKQRSKGRWIACLGSFVCRNTINQKKQVRVYLMKALISILLLDSWHCRFTLLKTLLIPSQAQVNYIFGTREESTGLVRIAKMYHFRARKMIHHLLKFK